MAIIHNKFEKDKASLYLEKAGMAFKATDADFNDGRIFAAQSFGEIKDSYPSLVQDMSAFEKLQETSDGLFAFGESFVEGGVSNIKGLVDAITNLPNADISAIRERAYKLSSDVIKYITDSQYRDSVNQEAMYDLKTDIAYGQILALQGDADKIGQVVGEASGKLASDLALSVATAGVGKVANQTIKTINKVDGDAITPNIPNNSDGIIDANVQVGDWDLGNVLEGSSNASTGEKPIFNQNLKKAEPKEDLQANTCATPPYCFTAGTLIETSEGLKAIETFTGGELIWTRSDVTLEYGYRPVIATKATPDQPIFQVTVKNYQGNIDTLETTSEHPFWIKDSGWLKASLLEQGMILLDRNNQEVEVLSQYLIPNHTETVYNFEVQDFHTYHIGEYGVWVHNAKCCDLANQNPVTETKRGVISNKKLTNNAIELDLTPKTQKQLKDIVDNGDISGAKTEDLFENVVKEHGGKVLTGGKYGSNNGYDHVVIFKDTDGKTYLTMTVDSKQLNSKGVKLDPKAAGGNMQMSDNWDDVVLAKLDENSDAYKAIKSAKASGSLVKGVAYVDKTTGKLKLVRINPTNPTKKKEKKKP